jgi:hypothetical protein
VSLTLPFSFVDADILADAFWLPPRARRGIRINSFTGFDTLAPVDGGLFAIDLVFGKWLERAAFACACISERGFKGRAKNAHRVSLERP